MWEVAFRRPEPADEVAVAEAQRVMAAEGFIFAFDYTPGGDFAEWLERTEQTRRGRSLPPDRVASTYELAIVDGEIAGRLSLRHELNEFLRNQGGHVGFCVLPGFRRRGVGHWIMRRGLELAGTLGIDRVLVTCDEDNIGSRRIIEAAGGAYASSYMHADGSPPTRRYWINQAWVSELV